METFLIIYAFSFPTMNLLSEIARLDGLEVGRRDSFILSLIPAVNTLFCLMILFGLIFGLLNKFEDYKDRRSQLKFIKKELKDKGLIAEEMYFQEDGSLFVKARPKDGTSIEDAIGKMEDDERYLNLETEKLDD